MAQWLSLGLQEPQTFNQAVLLAEAVGNTPEVAKVVAGQWQYESSGGSKVSAPFNYFGLKSHNEGVLNKLREQGINVEAGEEVGTTEGKGTKTKSSFMKFNNAIEAFAGHKAFLETNSRYQKALAADNAKDVALGLAKAGYATAPNYGETLYNSYIRPKELNPTSGDKRPKGLGTVKSSKLIAESTPTNYQKETNTESIELAPKPLESRSEFDPNPTTALGMPGSTAFQQQPVEMPAIPMDAEAGWFGSGKSMFELGGPLNNHIMKNGGIHIKPENKGKFTASANAAGMGVQAFANHVLANKEDYSSTQVKRANFAHNVAGWHHGLGGNMYANGGPLTEFNEGGKHHENPLGGIPQGIAPDGGTNLVEQGETKLDSANYIFSDTLKVDKETALAFGLPKTDVGKTFADVSKRMNRPNSRRENDTIEEAMKKRDLEGLMQAQEEFKAKDMAEDLAMMQAKHPDFMNALSQSLGQGQPPVEPQQDPNLMQQPIGSEQPEGQPSVDPAMQQQMAQQGGALDGIVPMALGGPLHQYGLGGFGDVMRNYGLGMADTFLSTVGANNVVQDSDYKGQGAELARKVSGVTGGIMKAALPTVANVVVPGSGALIGAAQQGIGMVNPEDEHTKQLREAQGIVPTVNTQSGLPLTYKTGGHMYAVGGYPQLTPGALSYINENSMENLPLKKAYVGGLDNYKTLQSPFITDQGKFYVDSTELPLRSTPQLGNLDNAKFRMLAEEDYLQKQKLEYEKAGLVQDASGNWVDKNPTTTNNNIAKTTSTATTTGNYPINLGLTDTTQDLSVNESPFGALANVAGIGYNLYQGIKKPKTMTPGDFYVGMDAIRPDYTEAENEARNTYAAYMKGLQQTGLSGGAAASNLQAGALERNRAMKDIASAEENAYRADQQHVRDINTQNMIQAKSAALQANWAIQAARQEHIKEAIAGSKDYQDKKTADQLATQYALLGAPDISKFKNVGYNTMENQLGNWWLNRRKQQGI